MPSDPLSAALRISWLSIGCSAVAGAASVAVGLRAHSLALVGSGATVLLDLSSSVVLVWRFRHPQGHLVAERRANIVAAAALFGLGVVLAALGSARLVTASPAHPTGASIGVAAASLVALPLIAARKYDIAGRVPSRALRADAHITVVGATTAAFTLTGLALTEGGLTIADPLAGLLVGLASGIVGSYELRGLLRPA